MLVIGYFWKNAKTPVKLKPNFFFENQGPTFVKNAVILTCAKFQKKHVW